MEVDTIQTSATTQVATETQATSVDAFGLDQVTGFVQLGDQYGFTGLIAILLIFYAARDSYNKRRGVWVRKDELTNIERLKDAELGTLRTENKRVHEINRDLIETIARTAEGKEATLAILQNLKPADDSAEGG